MNNQERPGGKGYSVDNVADGIIKPADRKLKNIALLKSRLEDAGHPVNHLVEPKSNADASRVYQSLINLCKKYNVDFRSNT